MCDVGNRIASNRMNVNCRNSTCLHKFNVGETVECWRRLNNSSGWKIGTIVSANVDGRNRRAYRYTVDWHDNSERSVNVEGKLIRNLSDVFSPHPIGDTGDRLRVFTFTLYLHVFTSARPCVRNAVVETSTVPLIPEQETTDTMPEQYLMSIDDENIPDELLKIVEGGRDMIAASMNVMSDEIKRMAQLPVSENTATSLLNKQRVENLKRILLFRGASTEGKKRELFERAYPTHAKELPPPRKKKKTAAQKQEEKQWKNCARRNKNLLKVEFRDWAKRQKNEVIESCSCV